MRIMTLEDECCSTFKYVAVEQDQVGYMSRTEIEPSQASTNIHLLAPGYIYRPGPVSASTEL